MKSSLEWYFRGLILGLILVAIFKYPAVKNYLTGNTMIVEYTWVGPNTVQIQANYDSAIPTGYWLYVYSVEPTSRYDNGFTTPNEGWDYRTYTTGWNGQVSFLTNHTEVIQAICVRTGTNPQTAFTNDTFTFDTSDARNWAIQIACR